MKPVHALVIAGVLAVAALAGVVAATRTTTLGVSAQQTSAASLAKRTQQLDRFEASLRKQLAAKPPKLPAVPSAPASVPVAAAPAAPAPAVQRVVYRRPAPIVVVKHRTGGEHESGDHEGHDGGGGGDD